MDHQHVSIQLSSISCGVLGLSALTSDPEKVLYALAGRLYHPSRGDPAAFIQWSDCPDSNGQLLDTFITKQFGVAHMPFASRWVENPKTGNNICVWLWVIPHIEFREYYRQQRISRAAKV